MVSQVSTCYRCALLRKPFGAQNGDGLQGSCMGNAMDRCWPQGHDWVSRRPSGVISRSGSWLAGLGRLIVLWYVVVSCRLMRLLSGGCWKTD